MTTPHHTPPEVDFFVLYRRFNAPITAINGQPVDCGAYCAQHNPSGKPYCCDIACAAPAAYHQEWLQLQNATDLWHEYHPAQGEEADLPEHMTLLACLGPDRCQRQFRAISCRQFPFFPYITADDRFIGLAYDWTFADRCWVIQNLWAVTDDYQREFVAVYDHLFDRVPGDYDSYYNLSAQMRAVFARHRRRIPILHRRGGLYLLSPRSERLQRVHHGPSSPMRVKPLANLTN